MPKLPHTDCSSAVKEPLFHLHDVIHEYVILTRLSNTIVLE